MYLSILRCRSAIPPILRTAVNQVKHQQRSWKRLLIFIRNEGKIMDIHANIYEHNLNFRHINLIVALIHRLMFRRLKYMVLFHHCSIEYRCNWSSRSLEVKSAWLGRGELWVRNTGNSTMTVTGRHPTLIYCWAPTRFAMLTREQPLWHHTGNNNVQY